MKKLILAAFLLLSASTALQAGGLLTNTNQTIAFLRNPAREASLEIDAAYSNPAGIQFLEKGFHFSLNIQNVYQERKINTTFAPYAGFGGSDTKLFNATTSVPVLPSIQAAYVTDKWAISGSIAITGGGGKATFNNGLGSFESQVSLIPALLSQNGIPATQYSVDSYIFGRQYIIGAQIGASYKVNDHLSVYAGGRMNYTTNSYYGYVKDIQANILSDGAGGTQMVNLSSYFTTVGEQALTAANSFKEAGDMAKYSEYLQKAGQAAALAGQTADKNLDCDQSGWGLTPIIGFDYKIGKFNFGAKYEFNTHMNIENQTKVDDTGLFADGVNTPHDIPALLAFGATYEILPTLRISAGYHHFFDKSASMASNKQEHLTKGTNEFLGGIEYDVCPWAQVSIGIQSTDYGLSDAYMNDMSFATDSYSIGFGAGFMLSKAVKLNVAYFFTNYEHYNKTQADFSGTGLPYQEDFTRDNKVVGVGVNYKF